MSFSTLITRRRALLAGAAFSLSACGRSSTDQSIRIGYQKNGVSLVAKQRGALDKALVAAGASKVEWTEFTSGVPLLEALSVGSIDIGSSGDTPPIFAQVGQSPMRYVAAQKLSGKAGGMLTPKDSSLKTLADVKGKSVCFKRGTSAHNSVVVALETVGLTLSDVKEVDLNPADAAAAFQQGGIDAWMIWDPYFTAAIKDQGARELISLATTGGGHSYFFAHERFIARQEAMMRAALDALAREGAWCEANRQAVAEMMAQETGLPLDLMVDTTLRADFALHAMSPEIIAAQQVIADRFLALGVIPTPIKIADATWTGWAGPA